MNRLTGKYGVKIMGLLLSLALLSACARQFTANTTASANKDGFAYSSNKNQENLDATGDIDPATGKMHFAVKTTAFTPEAAILAASQAQAAATKALSEMLSAVLPLIQSAVQGAAIGGGPGAGAAVAGRVLTSKPSGGSNDTTPPAPPAAPGGAGK